MTEVEEHLDSVSEAAPTPNASSGNPYWKQLGLKVVLLVALRLRRYFQPKAGGLKCSQAALKMWKDPKQRRLAESGRPRYLFEVGS